jgi:hypothetical protein
VYKKIIQFNGCNTNNVRYAAGHKHCNNIMKDAIDIDGNPYGYLLGGAGVEQGIGCNVFGFGYIDTTDNNELFVTFDLAFDKSLNKTDQYDEVVDCFARMGISNCLNYGKIWRNTTFIKNK